MNTQFQFLIKLPPSDLKDLAMLAEIKIFQRHNLSKLREIKFRQFVKHTSVGLLVAVALVFVLQCAVG